jgi:Rad3-related DNA helicase
MPKLRDLQIDAINWTKEQWKSGKKNIIISAPTGTGKSILALELAAWYNSLGIPVFILTAENSLLSQYSKDINRYLKYSNFVSLKSKQAYTCPENNNLPVKTHGKCVLQGMRASDAFNLECSHKCGYFQSRAKAPIAKTVLTNYAFWLKSMNFTYGQLGLGKVINEDETIQSPKEVWESWLTDESMWEGDHHHLKPIIPRPIIIMDEAHRLPDQIQSAYQFDINTSFIQNYTKIKDDLVEDGFYFPIFQWKWSETARQISELLGLKLANNEGILKSLIKIRDSMCYAYTHLINETSSYIKSKWENKEKLPPSISTLLCFESEFSNLYCRIDELIKLIDKTHISNLVCSYISRNARSFNFLDDGLLFKHTVEPWAETIIYMSATFGDISKFVKRLSLENQNSIQLDPKWNFEKSPIYFEASANFKHANKDIAFNESIESIDNILEKHQNENGIIHTGTYEFAQIILNKSKYANRLIAYKNAKEKAAAIKNVEDSKSKVLIGPSIFEGVDLPDSLCRFQIVAKLQYPNLSNRLWGLRCYGKDKWIYLEKPWNDLIQAIGRGVRNQNDWSVTYLLDTRFLKYITPKRLESLPQSWKSRFIKK